MIIDFNRYNGGGGSGSGSTDLTNYWNSAVTEQHIESAATEVYSSAVSYTDAALADISLDGYYTSGQTDAAIALAVAPFYTSAQTEEAITDKNYVTSAETEEQILDKNYVTSAQTEEQILAKNYITAEDIEPDVIYEAEGNDPGFYAINSSALTTWQIENLDLSPYQFVRFYIKASDIAFNSSDNFTAPMYVDVVLDPKSLSSQYQAYLGVTTNICAGNRNRSFHTVAAVDITKSKVQLLYQVSLWDVSTSSAANNGRYCYKIEGYRYNVCGTAENGGGGGSYTAGPNINISPAGVISVSGLSTINGSAITDGGNLVIQGGAGGNSNILAAISSLTEYEAISGSVKSGDLIQVYDVDINGDEEGEYGLFMATSVEQGSITWDRRDNGDSILWADKNYPWMAEEGIIPIDIGRGAFIISDTDPDSFNGIGFDDDGKPVITHIVPEYEEGEVTGMTREDTPIGGGLPVGYEAADQYSISENYQIVTVDGKVFGEDLDEVPAFHEFVNGYSDEERGYVIGSYTYVYGYYDGDDNFVPVFLPAGTYAILNTDDVTDTYGKVLNLFYGKIGDEDVIYNGVNYAQQLDSISLKTPLFTITEPTCPTTEDNYYELYLDYTDKPSAQSQIDVLDEVVSQAILDLNDKVDEKVQSLDVKNIVKLTQAEYDQLVQDDMVDPYTFYIIVNSI